MSNNGKLKVERAKVLENVQYSIPDDEKAIEAFPIVLDLLTPRWQDGHMTREEGRLTVVPDGSMWKVTLTCPTEKVQCSIYVCSLTSLFQEIEKSLSTTRVNWSQTWNARKKHLQKLDDPV